MRSSSRLGTAGECAFDALPNRCLGRLPVCDDQAASRIEAQMEQLQQIASNAGVTVERFGDIAQAERRAELAQIGGIRPERGRARANRRPPPPPGG